MAATKYTKSIITYFVRYEECCFKKSIEDSAIATALDRIDTVDDVIDIWFVDALSGGDQTLLNTLVSDHGLVSAKRAKIKAVDNRTGELIDAGFTYSSKVFSLSIPSQNKMTAAHQIKDAVAFVYPVVWNTIDDNDTYSITDATDMGNFYMTAIGTIRARLDSGTALKDSVRAAANVAAVDAVVDTR